MLHIAILLFSLLAILLFGLALNSTARILASYNKYKKYECVVSDCVEVNTRIYCSYSIPELNYTEADVRAPNINYNNTTTNCYYHKQIVGNLKSKNYYRNCTMAFSVVIFVSIIICILEVLYFRRKIKKINVEINLEDK